MRLLENDVETALLSDDFDAAGRVEMRRQHPAPGVGVALQEGAPRSDLLLRLQRVPGTPARLQNLYRVVYQVTDKEGLATARAQIQAAVAFSVARQGFDDDAILDGV